MSRVHHLEMIQSIIRRMAGNSFALKGWAVTLVSGIFALSSKDSDKTYFLVAYIPILVFWGLDAFYLRQERLFKALYDRVRAKDDETIDFDMNTSIPELQSEKTAYCNCILSKTEFWFYLPLALLSTAVVIITHIP
ncbi:MAG: hypothetical protein BWY28_03171 [bacterium ADurb.Bin236]|jgi:hypothetical protein|nr:MAG: hypothetical protein BWY28_03171 [bacterium ADurb.Bin236]